MGSEKLPILFIYDDCFNIRCYGERDCKHGPIHSISNRICRYAVAIRFRMLKTKIHADMPDGRTDRWTDDLTNGSERIAIINKLVSFKLFMLIHIRTN